MKDTRTISQILFSRRQPVDGFPALRGMQPLTYPARRNKGKGNLSAMLCKAVVVALRGDVLEIAVLEAPGRLHVRSRSQSHRSLLMNTYWTERGVNLPYGSVNYHLGLLLIAEALANKEIAVDLLDGWQELLTYKHKVRPDDKDPRYVELIGHVSDELYFWGAYRERVPTPTNRFQSLKVEDAANVHHVLVTYRIDPQVLTDVKTLATFRGGVEIPRTTEPPAVVEIPNARFRGWQLPELIEDLRLGFHCLLVGPTATGKSLSALEAFQIVAPDKAVMVLEGHESLREFDLLGGFVPAGKNEFVWRDGILVSAMRAGGFLLIDEANRMPTRTLNVLLGVLSRGAVVLTENGSEEVRAREGFQVVMAMNLGRGYAVNALDDALLNRFPITLEYRYLAPKEETELLVALTGLEYELAHVLVKVAQETRAKKRNHELSGEITPRGLLAWAEKLKGDSSKEDSVKGKPHRALTAQLQHTAKVTWMHAVAGVDAEGYLREEVVAELLVLIESHTPRGGAA